MGQVADKQTGQIYHFGTCNINHARVSQKACYGIHCDYCEATKMMRHMVYKKPDYFYYQKKKKYDKAPTEMIEIDLSHPRRQGESREQTSDR